MERITELQSQMEEIEIPDQIPSGRRELLAKNDYLLNIPISKCNGISR